MITNDPRLRFDGSISLLVLRSYLSRAVTHMGLLAGSPEPATSCFDDDLRMLAAIGARFIGRSACAWSIPADDEAHFVQVAERAEVVHRAIPEAILQAAIFEAVYRQVENIPIPDWVFAEFGQPIEARHFRYESMLYADGRFHDHWGRDASVPDMSQLETRLWFFYRARRYIDAGCEALHLGKVHLMDQADPGHAHWFRLVMRIHRYASRTARRRMVLCDAHTHGVVEDGKLLFDFHSFPLRPSEVTAAPRLQSCELLSDYSDTIIGHSLGGTTASGWTCDSLPYLVEFDNFGVKSPGKGGLGVPWVWGYDEICWFAHQNELERNRFLAYAASRLRRMDPVGHLQPATRRILAAPVEGEGIYHANIESDACPKGFGQEEAIWTLFSS